jgi:two-component system, NtrC family, response regulator AtoC
MPRILLAEDDEIIRISVSDRLKQYGWLVDEAEDGLQAAARADKQKYNLVISDIRMPGLSGLALLDRIREQSPETEVFIMTAYGSIDDARACLRQGAADYILKPFDMDDLIIRVTRLLDIQAVKARCASLEASCQAGSSRLIGSDPAMRQVFTIIEQAAPTNATILITGESGTGKELAARAIHQASPRRNSPFVSINCAAIPEGLMESDLFGHERGAFTGADHMRKGKFEMADNGTLLLDELGELPGPLQAKLLRVLQESKFERVGGSKTISVDVRILACTSKNLQQEVAEGRFRQDLLFRLKVIPVTMPPLRHHKEDIPEMCQNFLQEFRLARHKALSLSPAALRCLQSYDFPGNVRELRNLMERASVLSKGPEIMPADLPAEIGNLTASQDVCLSLAENMALAEQNFLRKALAACDGQRTETARALGISRKNLWEKLKEYGIE